MIVLLNNAFFEMENDDIKYCVEHIKNNDYYELVPILDSSLKIVVPVNSDYIRKVISIRKDLLHTILMVFVSIQI